MKTRITAFLLFFLILIQLTAMPVSVESGEVQVLSGQLSADNGLPEYFTAVNYTYDINGLSAELSMEALLDSDYISEEISEGLITSLMEQFSVEEPADLIDVNRAGLNAAVDLYFQNLSITDNIITLSLKFSAADFDFSSYTSPATVYATGTDIPAAQYSFSLITESEKSYYILSFEILNSALWLTLESCSFDLVFSMKNNQGGTPVYTFGASGNEMTAKNIGEPEETEEPEKDAEYTLTKTAYSRSESDFYITYEINLSVVNGTLNNKKLVDALPHTSLMLCKAEATVNGASVEITDPSAFVDENSTFNYTFTGADDITRASFLLTYCLNEAAFKAYVESTDHSISITGIKNTASLIDTDGTTVLKSATTRAAENIKATFIEKNGVQNSFNKQQIDWTIKLNTKFSHSADTYIIDKINNAGHQYGDFVTINKNGGGDVVYTISAVDSTNYTDALTAAQAKALMSGLPLNTVAKLSPANADYDLLIIPVDVSNVTEDSLYANAGNSFVIKYSTLVRPDEDYNGNIAGGSASAIAKNEAKLIYSHMCTGSAPGPAHNFIADFSIIKEISLPYEFFYKSVKSYTEDRQEIVWRFDINRYGGEFAGAYIKDEIAEGLTLTGADAITLITYNRFTGEKKSEALLAPLAAAPSLQTGTAPSTTPGYYFDALNNDVYINTGAIKSDEVYSFELKTLISDIAYLSDSSEGKFTYTNTAYAYIQQNIASEVTEQLKVSQKEVENPLFAKSLSESSFDYTDNTVEWKLTVNPYKVNIANLTISDIIPAGMTFDRFTKIVVTPVSGPAFTTDSGPDSGVSVGGITVTWSVESNTGERDKLTIAAADSSLSGGAYIEDTMLELYFRTAITDEYIKNDMIDGTTKLFENTATLTGTAYFSARPESSAESNINITKNAVFELALQQVQKTGVMYAEQAVVSWTVFANTARAGLAGMEIEDDFTDNIYLELDPESMRVYTAAIQTDGTLSVNTAEEITDEIITAGAFKGIESDTPDERGFVFVIPQGYDDKIIALVFNTDIIASAAAGNIGNELECRINEVSVLSTGAYRVNSSAFSMEAYALVSQKPLLRITASDKNNSALKLSGVEYTITYTTKKNRSITKIRTTGAGGTAMFINLPADTVILLTETASAPNYRTIYKEQTIVFLSDPSLADSFDADIKYNPDTPVLTMLINEVNEGIVPASFSIVKKDGDDGSPLQNVEFRLESEENYYEMNGFTGESGELTFSGLYSGTYTLSETRVGGYKRPKQYTVIVTESENVCSVASADELVFTEGAYLVENEKNDPGSFTVYAYNTSDSLPMEGLTFELTMPDNSGFFSSAVTDVSGNAVFNNLGVGTYRLAPVISTPDFIGSGELICTFVLEDDSDEITLTSISGDSGDIELEPDNIYDYPVTPVVTTGFKLVLYDAAQGKPMKNAAFTLLQDSAELETVITDSEGCAEFTGLNKGVYTLVQKRISGYKAPLSYTISVELDGCNAQISSFKRADRLEIIQSGGRYALINERQQTNLPFIPDFGNIFPPPVTAPVTGEETAPPPENPEASAKPVITGETELYYAPEEKTEPSAAPSGSDGEAAATGGEAVVTGVAPEGGEAAATDSAALSDSDNTKQDAAHENVTTASGGSSEGKDEERGSGDEVTRYNDDDLILEPDGPGAAVTGDGDIEGISPQTGFRMLILPAVLLMLAALCVTVAALLMKKRKNNDG